MASEAYDSGRTRLFEQANFTGSFNQPNVVEVLTTPPQDVYLTPYNVVYRNADSMFVYGGGYGDQGGMGAYIAKLDAKTLQQVWFKQLQSPDPAVDWIYPGVVGILKDGLLYLTSATQLLKVDPTDGSYSTLTLPTNETNDWPPADTAYNGFVALPDGTIITKTVYREQGCPAQGFSAFLKLPQFGTLCQHPKDVPDSVLVAIDPERMQILHRIRIPAFTVGRGTSSRFDGKDYIYVPGPKDVYRYIWENRRFREDPNWGPVRYNEAESGQTPAPAGIVMNDWIMFTTNGAEIDQPPPPACKNELGTPCLSPWLTVWAVDQAHAFIRHRIQPFQGMVAPPPTDPNQKPYPLSFAPSAPTGDPLRNRIFVFDAGPGKLAALDLTPQGFLHQPTWIVDQRTTEFMALIGPRNRRVLVTTEIPQGQPLETNSSNSVVWRDADSGRKLAEVDSLEPVLSGTMVEPGYTGPMYYLGNSNEIKKLTVRPAR